MAKFTIELEGVDLKALELTTEKQNGEALQADDNAKPRSPEEYLQFVNLAMAQSWGRDLGLDKPPIEQTKAEVSDKLDLLNESAIAEIAALVEEKIAAGEVLPVDPTPEQIP